MDDFAETDVSSVVARTAPQEEMPIGVDDLIVLPLTIVSGCFMQLDLASEWIQDVAAFNPANRTTDVPAGGWDRLWVGSARDTRIEVRA